MKYLKQTWSGEIYVWTPQLAQRPDMVPHVPDEPAPEPKKRMTLKQAMAAKAEELKE